MVEEEIKYLDTVKQAKRPLTIIMGGAKVSDKLELIYSLAEKADYILLGGAMSLTFLSSLGYNMGKSLIEKEQLNNCKNILDRYKEKIILPVDFKCFKSFDNSDYIVKKIYEFDNDDMALDIDNLTAKLYKSVLNKTNTCFWNGPLGVVEKNESKDGSLKVLEYLNNLNITTILGGGDIVGFATKEKMDKKIDKTLHIILNANKLLILLVIVIMLVAFSLQSYGLYKIAKEYNNELSFKDIFKQIIIVQFFNGITPFSTGGQPMQVYMLNKSGLSIANSTITILQNSILFQVALVLCGILAVLFNRLYSIFGNDELLARLTILGFIFNVIAGIGLLLFTFSTSLAKKITFFIINILNKIKIIKNKNKHIEKWNKEFEEFENSGKKLRKNTKLTITVIFVNFLAFILLSLIPYFIIKATDPYSSITIVHSIVGTMYVYLISAFVPIPGGSGGIEFSFSKFFSPIVISNSVISASLILWRFITYYVPMIIGAIVLNFFRKHEK